MRQHVSIFAICTLFLCLCGCQTNVKQDAWSSQNTDNKVAVISLTSDPLTHPQSVNMGLTFAGFCLDEGYDVAIFFNVKE